MGRGGAGVRCPSGLNAAAGLCVDAGALRRRAGAAFPREVGLGRIPPPRRAAERPFETLAEAFRWIAGVMRAPAMREVLRDPFAVRYSPFIRLMSQVRRGNALVMGALGRLLDGPAGLRAQALEPGRWPGRAR